MQVSREFKIRIKLATEPQYRIAQRARVTPDYISKLLSGVVRVSPEDPRLRRLARALKLRVADCIQENGGGNG